jgi:UDP-N-acetylmuramoyl-L-alanyl-D-glutamate--2,6-diaminopimelate ligase
MEGYLQAKALLFKNLKGLKQPKIGMINGDDPASKTLLQVSAAPTVTYGVHAANLDYKAENIQLTAHGIEMTVYYRGKSQEIRYSTPGMFSVYNSLAAFAWAIESGCDAQLAADALAEIRGVPGRFENVRIGQPFPVIVDYAHTPDGLENVLKTAREFTQGRLITVFGCGGDRDKGKRPQMGEISARLSDYVVVTSDNPRTEEPDQIIKDILVGVTGVEYTAMVNRREAIETACRMAKPGDTVLIAGKGHEDYQINGKETFPFDDREVAKDALRGLGYVE